jgi:hypothetical protein
MQKTTVEHPNSIFPTRNLMNFKEIPQESPSRLHQIAIVNLVLRDLMQTPYERIKVIVHQNRD